MFCKDCGGTMVGDGHTLASQCEFASSVDCVEPDSGPHYCGFREEKPASHLVEQGQARNQLA
jgi:hypothetical protein